MRGLRNRGKAVVQARWLAGDRYWPIRSQGDGETRVLLSLSRVFALVAAGLHSLADASVDDGERALAGG